MKKIDIAAAQTRTGSRYPPPFNETGKAKFRQRLGAAAGLTQFGVNRLELPPGQWSSQRHWHTLEDEFVIVLSGQATLITNAGEELLNPGDCAGFRAGESDGHHIINRSDALLVLLEVGANHREDVCHYPDIDLRGTATGYLHKDGAPY